MEVGMIEKIVTLSLILIGIGGFGSVIECVLFGTTFLILLGWGALIFIVTIFVIALYYCEKDKLKK